MTARVRDLYAIGTALPNIKFLILKFDDTPFDTLLDSLTKFKKLESLDMPRVRLAGAQAAAMVAAAGVLGAKRVTDEGGALKPRLIRWFSR